MTNAWTVLVVEDNPIERKGLAAVLRQEGYDVVVAANGKEALTSLSSKPTPDVMLLDMMTSEADGWQLLKMLRSHPELPAPPIIIITGLGVANLEWARSLNAVGLMRKLYFLCIQYCASWPTAPFPRVPLLRALRLAQHS